MSKLIDLTGNKYGRLTPIEYIGNGKWRCRCDCGNIISVFKTDLVKDNGTVKSCGCVYIDELKKEIGRRKNHLQIIGVKQYGRKGRVVVKCDCGSVKEMQLGRFLNPCVHSCGCVGAKRGSESPNFKHGMSRTRIYNVYRDMYNRCYNPSDISYPNYGKRGICICEEWLGNDGINNFCEWAYSNGYDKNAKRGDCTIDRKDPNGNYSPDNCRWVDLTKQLNNKNNNRYFEIDGVTKTMSEWCREYNISCVQSVYSRIKKGMDIKTALTKPMQKKKADMTAEELEERRKRKLEYDRKWRAEHKEQIQASREKWKRSHPEEDKESKRKYEEKKKLERKMSKS